jgi:hypothetical protein
MRVTKNIFLAAAMLFVACATVALVRRGLKPAYAAESTAKRSLYHAACLPPTEIEGSPQETAWRLLIAATCPVNSNQYPYVTWENWIEQNQLYPENPASGLVTPTREAPEKPGDFTPVPWGCFGAGSPTPIRGAVRPRMA